MKSRMLFASVLLFAVTSLFAADEPKLDGIKCPISGKPVVAASGTDYKGGKVYFCCENCPNDFQENTAKFAAKANQQLLATGQAKEVKCPLTGEALDTSTAINVAGTKVCFCCEKCQAKVTKAKGDAQLNLIFNNKAFAKGFKVGT